MDTGDTAWMLTSTALVLFMTPGLAFFYGGMVRSKNVLGMLMQNFFAMGLIAVIWAIVGFTLVFGDFGNGGFIGNFDFFGLKDVHRVRRHPRPRRRLPAGADDPACPVRGLPDDLRRHHPGPDHRRHGRPHEVQRLRAVHRPVAGAGVRAGRALGLRRRLDHRHGRPRLRRRRGRPHERRRRGPGRHPRAGQAQGLAAGAHAAPQPALHPAGHRHPVVRLVRVQRRLGARRQRPRRARP